MSQHQTVSISASLCTVIVCRPNPPLVTSTTPHTTIQQALGEQIRWVVVGEFSGAQHKWIVENRLWDHRESQA